MAQDKRQVDAITARDEVAHFAGRADLTSFCFDRLAELYAQMLFQSLFLEFKRFTASRFSKRTRSAKSNLYNGKTNVY